MQGRVVFNRPYVVGTEFGYVTQAIQAMHLSGDGQFSRRCQEALQRVTGARRALLTTSCTSALEMAALLLDIGPGDEVIVPSFTFVSTANAFALRGARPIFADSRPDTLNMDEKLIEGLVTPRTKAIVVVHYAGVACEMDPILAVGARYGIPVVEDNAHGLFGRYRGRALGSLGVLATLSFHETKNISCGEGGALLVNDPRFERRAEILREKGTDRAAFFRGETDKYTWVDVGSSFLPSDILAAFLWAQLEAAESIQARRVAIWRRYQEGLADWAATAGVDLPTVPPHCEHPAHLFYLKMPTGAHRDAMMAHLSAAGINSVFHYVPLHSSPAGRRFGQADRCPVAEDVAARLLRLPFYTDLEATAQESVIETVKAYRVSPASSAVVAEGHR